MLDRSAQPNLFVSPPGTVSPEKETTIPRGTEPLAPRTAPRSRPARIQVPTARTPIGGRVRHARGRFRLGLRYLPVVGLVVVLVTHSAGFGSGSGARTRATGSATVASSPAVSAAPPVSRWSRAQTLPVPSVKKVSRQRAPSRPRRAGGRPLRRLASRPVGGARLVSARPPPMSYAAVATTPSVTSTQVAAAPPAYAPAPAPAEHSPSSEETSSPSERSKKKATGELGF